MKKILIIGATSSIAKHSARIWASRGNMLYLAARNEDHVQIISADLIIRGAAYVGIHITDLNNIESHVSILNAADNAMDDATCHNVALVYLCMG